jgi:phosphatidylserine decarboxylase
MRIHKEGRVLLTGLFFALLLINLLVIYFTTLPFWVSAGVAGITGIVFLFFLQFFRVPKRTSQSKEGDIVCPADGKVVVIEKTIEEEVLGDERIQISIFMSPLNVHVNWNPISGLVSHFKYHPGKFLVAWHPKSSTENERTTVVVDRSDGLRVLYRQIAGAVARRIVWYLRKGMEVKQADEFGFIKFGSRIDVFLPTDAEIYVKIGDKTVGKDTILANVPLKK